MIDEPYKPSDEDDELTVNEPELAYDLNRLYTVEEWEEIREYIRCELHDGRLVIMDTPVMEAPGVKHQRILADLITQLHTFLKGKPCKVFPAPFSVCLNKTEYTVLEPDIVVVCDDEKLSDGKRCNGAPDMVVEVLSPSTAHYDLGYKFKAYQMAGVKEYWIVDPDLDIVQVNVLQNGSYITYKYDSTDTVKLTALKGCEINLADVFEG